jgi:hypothetical protein
MTLTVLSVRHNDNLLLSVLKSLKVGILFFIISNYCRRNQSLSKRITVSAFNIGISTNPKLSFSTSFVTPKSSKRNGYCVSVSATSSSTAASDNYRKINSALFSPSGKLSISPEIIIPDPKDPTALLLLASSVQTLSSRVRIGMANIVFIQSNSIDSVRIFSVEQQNAYGSIPSPLPIVYCDTKYDNESLAKIADAGANGVLVPLTCQKDCTLSDLDQWKSICQQSLAVGLQPIPEIIVHSDIVTSLTESHIENFIEALTKATDNIPAACVISIPSVVVLNESNEDEEEDDDEIGLVNLIQTKPHDMSEMPKQSVDESTLFALPIIPKALGKKVPILGSIRVIAGDNRLSAEATTLKTMGYTGAMLRVDCIPGYQAIQYDLGIISQFWSACISDLKSLKSKSFGFRSKNNMDMTSADKWIRYRKSVIDSGALGAPNEDESSMSGLDTAAGDYRGFA